MKPQIFTDDFTAKSFLATENTEFTERLRKKLSVFLVNSVAKLAFFQGGHLWFINRGAKLAKVFGNKIIFFFILFILSACTSLAIRPEGQQTIDAVQTERETLSPVIPAASFDATLTPFQPVDPSPSAPPPTTTQTPSITPLPSLTPTETATQTPAEPPVISLLFTGVIVPGRCVQAGIDARDQADYIYEEVRELIQQADLAVGTLNATISDYPPHTGCVFTYVLVGDARNADALQRAGFDAMSVATNHIKNCGLADCGDRAFLETLENLRRVGITPIGAGNNLAEALQPAFFTIKGVRFGIVSLGMIEPMAFAGEDSPGIAILNEENLRQAIAAARQEADVVIAMPHWGPEDSSLPNGDQLALAQVAVEAGADVVVGNHTHVVQAMQQIAGIDVFYGLGNFVFDQTWDLAHQQGVILRLTFEGKRYRGYEFIPTHVDGDGTVHIAGEAEAAEILQRIREASETLK